MSTYTKIDKFNIFMKLPLLENVCSDKVKRFTKGAATVQNLKLIKFFLAYKHNLILCAIIT